MTAPGALAPRWAWALRGALLWLWLCLLCGAATFAAPQAGPDSGPDSSPNSGLVPVPPLKGHVTDLTGTLSAEQQATLEATLAALEARKGSQLAVLLVPSTAPEAIEPYAIRVVEQWKLGRKQVDDGALLLVAKNDRTLRIEVGYGLEGVLTDLLSQRIINETIVPRFKQGDYAGGVSEGVARLISVIDGEALPPPPVQRRAPEDAFGAVQQFAPVLFVVALALGGVLRAVLGRLPGALVTGGVVSAIAWFMVGALSVSLLAGLAALVVTLLGVGTLARGLASGGGRGGRGGGWGGGGGGFSGGGGGFGGGGASGRW